MERFWLCVAAVLVAASMLKGLLAVLAPPLYAALQVAESRYSEARNALVRSAIRGAVRLIHR